jgi:uncharacterized protein with FMN-binding domain
MKKLLIVLAVIIVSGGVITIAGTIGMDEVNRFRIPAVDISSIDNGIYTGECDISRWALKVNVAIENHKIKNITIKDKKMSNISNDIKEQYDKKIIGTEKPVFDSVSSASVTGKAYMIAVTDALVNAQKRKCECF